MDLARAETRLRRKWMVLALRLMERARRECKFSTLLEIRELVGLARLQGAVMMTQLHLSRERKGENFKQADNTNGISLEELDQIISKMESEEKSDDAGDTAE